MAFATRGQAQDYPPPEVVNPLPERLAPAKSVATDPIQGISVPRCKQAAETLSFREAKRFVTLAFQDSEIFSLLVCQILNLKDDDKTALEVAASNYAWFGQFPEYSADRDTWHDVAKMLLKLGADYDLHSACYLGDVDRARVLLEDKKQAGDRPAMRIAAQYGRAQIVKLLLQHGADPEGVDGYSGLSISYFAVAHADVLRLLFDAGANPKIEVTYRGSGLGPEGSTLLHEAAKKGAVESAKLLVKAGLDVNVAIGGGLTPLHEACWEGHVRMVEWLLANKGNGNARTKSGWTPMSLTASRVQPGNPDNNAPYLAIIKALQGAGIETDIYAAIVLNDVRRVAAILQREPRSVAKRDPDGLPALHWAVKFDRREIVKLLLDQGCDPNMRQEDERCGGRDTALQSAAIWGRLEIAKVLIEHGANVNAKSEGKVVPLQEKITALHYAARWRTIEFAELLLNHGADVYAKDDEGKTPLDWAEMGQVPGMSKFLRERVQK
jgi:ankyrin repeat protein